MYWGSNEVCHQSLAGWNILFDSSNDFCSHNSFLLSGCNWTLSYELHPNKWVLLPFSVREIGWWSVDDDEMFLCSKDASKLVRTEYSAELTNSSHKCNRLNCRVFNFYCEIIEIHTTEEGYYVVTTASDVEMVQHLYENNFTLFDLATNAIEPNGTVNCDSQMEMVLYRQMNTSFILILTTYDELEQGRFSITVNGPSNVSIKRTGTTHLYTHRLQTNTRGENWQETDLDLCSFNDFILDHVKSTVQSNYSSDLSDRSHKYGHQNCRKLEYYYEVLQVDINTSGYYMFSSASTLDTYGYLYNYPFDPHDSVGTSLAWNDNDCCGDLQFTIMVYLKFNTTYVLVITTSYKHIFAHGPFSVIIKGPDRIDMKGIGKSILNCNLKKSRECSSSRSWCRSDYAEHALFLLFEENIPSIVQSVFSAQLTANSSKYGRESCRLAYYYYESIQINVNQSGTYTLASANGTNTYGSLFQQHFNPYNPSETAIPYHLGFCLMDSFRITIGLQCNLTYILIVSTRHEEQKGTFSILASGPNNVILNRISKAKI